MKDENSRRDTGRAKRQEVKKKWREARWGVRILARAERLRPLAFVSFRLLSPRRAVSCSAFPLQYELRGSSANIVSSFDEAHLVAFAFKIASREYRTPEQGLKRTEESGGYQWARGAIPVERLWPPPALALADSHNNCCGSSYEYVRYEVSSVTDISRILLSLRHPIANSLIYWSFPDLFPRARNCIAVFVTRCCHSFVLYSRNSLSFHSCGRLNVLLKEIEILWIRRRFS